MPIDWEYREALARQKNPYKNQMITDMQEFIQGQFNTNYIDEFVVKIDMPKYRKIGKLNFSEEFPCIIKTERLKEKIYNLNSRGILTYPNVLRTGDYVTLNEDGVSNTYIVRSRIDEKKTHDYTFLLHCQHDIKILDKDGITIHRYPIASSDNKTKLGESERSDTATTLNSTYQGYVRYDEISRRFMEDCEAGKQIKRVLINGRAYNIVGTDDLTMAGLITLGLEIDQKNNNDNLELGIADYYNNVSPTPTTSTIVGEDEIFLGDTQEYTIDSPYFCSWSINDVGIDIISTDGENSTKCTVKCKSSTQYKGNIATLTCFTNGQTYIKQIKIKGF